MENNVKQNAQPVNKLFRNSMGIQPSGVVYDFTSDKIENTVLRWLEDNGCDTSNLVVRCVDKSSINTNKAIARFAARTQLPFVVILFRSITNDDYTVQGGMDASVRKNILRSLNNMQDTAQFILKDNSKLNGLISKINNDSDKPHWTLQRKQQQAYTVLSSDNVMALCFCLGVNEAKDYVIDFVHKPKTRMNPNTRRTEMAFKVVLSRVPAKRRPVVDPINYIR